MIWFIQPFTAISTSRRNTAPYPILLVAILDEIFYLRVMYGVGGTNSPQITYHFYETLAL